MGHRIQRGSGIAAERLHGLAQIAGVVEAVHAVGGLFEARADVQPFAEHERPARYAHHEQDHEDRLGHQRGLGKKGKNAQIHTSHLGYVCIFWDAPQRRLTPRSRRSRRAPAITKVPTTPERRRKKTLVRSPGNKRLRLWMQREFESFSRRASQRPRFIGKGRLV